MSEALCLTPEQVKALGEIIQGSETIQRPQVNGNVALYGGQVVDDVEFVWADFDGYLRTYTVTPAGLVIVGKSSRVES